MENDKLLHQWINGTLSPEELEKFRQRPEYDSLVALYQHTEHLAAPPLEEQALLDKILATPKKSSKVVSIAKKSFFRPWMGYAAAVALVALSALLFFNRSDEVSIQLAKGDRLEGQLPGSSTFVLNAESELSYHKNTWSEMRQVELTGEAFFKVKKGAPFQVLTPTGTVKVLGTSFNVKARKNFLDVYCTSGKVAVLNTTGAVLKELNPQEAIRIKEGRIEEEWTLPNGDANDWFNGITKLRKVPLSIVLEELERQFDIQITANGIDTEEMVTCNFQHKDLNLALKTTLTPLKINYQILNDQKVSLQKD